MKESQRYEQPKSQFIAFFNQWDFIVLILFFGFMAATAWGIGSMTQSYQLGQSIPISTDPRFLPKYALATVIRMTIALCCSFLFTLIVGSLAAKSKRAEKIIIPFIDIMQSVPVLGFLSFSVLAFIRLFPGSQLGPECAAIFAIFTSQVWNMALSFYQSLRMLPQDLKDASAIFNLGPWQKFWRVEVPFATPGLIWNAMMSLSAGWFFVVASEAISVANQHIMLPGIGSYIMLAQQQENYAALGYVILTMLIVIIIYDQLLFRPLLTWSEQFQYQQNEDTESSSWFLTLIRRSKLIKTISYNLRNLRNFFVHPRQSDPKKLSSLFRYSPKIPPMFLIVWQRFLDILFIICLLTGSFFVIQFIYTKISFIEILKVFYLGLITTIKVTILIILSSLIWVPIGVWVGLHPKLSRYVQPIAQFLAAFPANLVYPIIFMAIFTYNLNVEIWTAPLMILGTQWYILFNVIAGTNVLPLDIKYAAKNYQIKGWLWWKKIMLPAIFPYYVTGAMTAAGGCWNASIVADVVEWGGQRITATGLGGYITHFTATADFPRIVLGIAVMCLYVTLINRFLWRKLYILAETRYNIS